MFQSQSQNIKEHSVRIVSTAFLLFFLITSPVRAAINGVAAVVNGEMITAFDLQAETAPEAMRRGLNPKDPNQAAAIEELTKATLERMINNIILTQEAQRLKILVGDSEVDNEIQQIMSRNKMTPEEFREVLFKDLPKIISQIKSRNYKFIIYMDDLSFEEFEIEYKYLKAVIEGGLETKPDNVLIYATSNRRHLIKESFDDVKDYKPELHSSDTVQEKLSLVARFGVTIYYGAPEKQEYDDIVINLAKKNGIEMDTDELLLEAGRWELNHGGRSGRCAQQFIIYLLGQKALKKQ